MGNNPDSWIGFALQQMAAESYLDGIELQDDDTVGLRLIDGNNDTRKIAPTPEGDLPGTVRMTTVLAQRFIDTYDIVDHHANDASGFSATLFRYVEDGVTQYTLSFRSTEPLPFAQGGDVNRDGLWALGLTPAADGEIGINGFAFGQLLAMERYFANLTQGKLTNGSIDSDLQAFFNDPSNRINVTGYSLGGHLATIFTELHDSQVDQTYIFNGPGRGRIAGFTETDVVTLQEEVLLIDAMLDRFSAVLLNPIVGVTGASDLELVVYRAAQELHDLDPTWNPFQSGATENLYLDPRYQWAKLATLDEYHTVGTATLEVLAGFKGIAIDQGTTPKIHQFYGLAATNDANLIAASGLFYGPVQPILIEGQPLLVGEFGIPRFTESGSSHSLTLIVDSLAVQELIHSIDSRYGQAGAELLIKAASRTRAVDGVAPADEENVAEADSLERTVDAFRKLFRDQSLGPISPLQSDSKVGGFANFQNRNALYSAMAEIYQAVMIWQEAGAAFHIDDLTDLTLLPSSDPMSPENVAQMATAQGLAYRYALKELNPFALIATDDLVTTALYEVHNSAGQLDLFNPLNGTGTMTAQYIQDRALFLAEKLAVSLADRMTSDGPIYFFDMSQTYELATEQEISTTRQFLFGSESEDRFTSGSSDDHIFGGAGVDLLIGNGGNDYLQGDSGGDQLDGGEGNDTLVGGIGNDVLEGGTGNDVVDGGLDNDVLRGGTGIDRYIIRAFDGADTLEDSDGKGVVEFEGKILIGGLRRTSDPTDVFRSGDGSVRFEKLDADLFIVGSGPLTIKNFSDGMLGIKLLEESAYTNDLPTRTEFLKTISNPAPPPSTIQVDFFDNGNNDSRLLSLAMDTNIANNVVHARGGDDFLISGGGNDQLYGDDGNDEMYGGLGDDRLYGGIGNDELLGDNVAVSTSGGDDFLHGGEGDDFLQGGAGRDVIFGGTGNDSLNGDEFAGDNSSAYDDYLDGGDGDDFVHGGAGGDIIIGGSGNDQMIGDATQFQNGAPEAGGNDSIDGGVGDDQLFGVYGEDVLSGGMGHDLINGQDGSDVLYGGDGNDTLSGDLRIVAIGSGYDTREYRAAGGEDLLLGEAGQDVLTGGERNDFLDGGPDNDLLFGDYLTGRIATSDPLYWTLFTVSGDDHLQGGGGNDVLHGGYGTDLLLGGDGHDTLIGGAGDDVLESGADDDVLYGEYALNSPEFFFNPFISSIRAISGNDRLDGGAGQDQLYGGLGDDTLHGGAGNDQLIDDEPSVGAVGGNDTLDGGDGDDIIQSWWGDDVVHGGTGDDRLTSFYGYDVLYGDEGNDWLSSGFEVEGSGSADTLMVGGFGDDTYWIDGIGDVVVEDAANGIDTVASFISYTLPEFVENLALLGLVGIGNGLNNVMSIRPSGGRLEGLDGDDDLSGYVGDDTLDGGAGNDRLFGDVGNDRLIGGAGSDIYLINMADGVDTIEDSALGADMNRIQFGDFVLPTDLMYVKNNNTLDIVIGNRGGIVRLMNFDPAGTNGSLVVSSLHFFDGSIVNLTDLFPAVVNHAPTLVNPLVDQIMLEEVPLNIAIPANTFTDEDSGDVLTYGGSLADGNALPDWLTFDPETQTFRGMPDDAQVGSLDLRVTATDTGNLTASAVFTLTVQNVNEAPSVATSIADQLAVEDAQFSFVVPTSTFHDVDADDLLTYRATLADGDALPAWISFEDSGTFSGTPLNEDVGNLNIAVTATDLSGLSVTAPFAITVQNLNDAPIVANPLSDQEAAEDSPFSLSIPSATFADADAVHGDQLAYSVAQADGNALPTWLSFDASSLTLSGTPGPGDSELLQIAVTATDTEGAGTTDQFALTISGPLPKALMGTAGNDVLIGGRGDDVLSGLAGNDQLVGGQGNDMLDGGAGNDAMQGGPGNDTYVVDASGDTVAELADEGMDWVQSTIVYTLGANVENLTLAGTTAINGTGNALNNVLIGNGGNNRLSGGAGNDRLDGGVGSDTMIGGMGDDTYVVNQAGDVVTENLNEGTDTVESSISYALGSNLENLTLKGTANLAGTGNTLNNILIGNSGNNAFDGGADNDIVDGGAGNDTLQGGSGDDSVLGGLGDDVLSAGSGNDVLDGGDGIDILDGGSGNDILRGGAGNDTLAGGSGADQLTGGTGNDTLAGGSGNDLYNFARGDGRDTIGDADSLKGNQDRLLFGTTIDPLDLVISRQVNDLRLTIHGTSDSVAIQNWYTTAPTNQIEDLQAGNGEHLLNTQVDQLIQAMASFSQQTGLTWDQAIDQRPQEVQTILAASWH